LGKNSRQIVMIHYYLSGVWNDMPLPIAYCYVH
jgi:hypothetical protein